MKPIVVDTNVISLIFKKHSLSQPYVDLLENRQLVISFMTLAELRLWPLSAGWGQPKREKLEQFLDNFAVFYCDAGLCQAWAEVRDQCFREGRPIDVADAWIAATALYLDFPLVTHNREHFEKVRNLQVLSRS